MQKSAEMKRLIQLIQNLSLDVTAGAVISSLFVAKVFEVRLTRPMLIGLGAAIWLIYTADHLLDAKKSALPSYNSRHQFHKQYKTAISLFALLVFLVGIANLAFLPLKTIYLGFALAALVGLYLGSVHLFKPRWAWHKEMLAAIIYTVGIFVAPLSLVNQFTAIHGFLFFQFLLLVIANLLLFPIFELPNDQQDGLESIAILRGKSFVRQRALGILLLSFASIAFGLFWFDWPIGGISQITLLAMSSILWAMLFFEGLFQKNQRYRLFGDGMFFIPLIALLY